MVENVSDDADLLLGGKIERAFLSIEQTVRNIIEQTLREREARRPQGNVDKWWEGQLREQDYKSWIEKQAREQQGKPLFSYATPRELYFILHYKAAIIAGLLYTTNSKDRVNIHQAIRSYDELIGMRNKDSHVHTLITLQDVKEFLVLNKEFFDSIPSEFHDISDEYKAIIAYLSSVCQDHRERDNPETLYQKFKKNYGFIPRTRDFALVLIGLLGIVFSSYLILGQRARTDARQEREADQRKQKEDARQRREAEEQARQEEIHQQQLYAKRRQEEQLKLAAEKRRQEALKAQALQEEQERQRQEDEERRLREEAERRRQAQLETLRQAGIRSAPLAPTSATPPSDAVGTWVALRSVPNDADVFLDWSLKGRTPLWLNGITVTGFLMVVKDGYRPWFRHANFRENIELPIDLSLEESQSPLRLLLVVDASVPADTFSILRTQLAKTGFSVPGMDAMNEFVQAEQQSGGLSRRAFCAWARASFGTDKLVRVAVRSQSRDLGAQHTALGGATRSFIDMELNIYDLRSGSFVDQLVAEGSVFALGQEAGEQKALREVSKTLSTKLQTWLREHTKG